MGFNSGFKGLICQGVLIIMSSQSHSDKPHSVGILWANDQPDAKTSTWRRKTLTRGRHSFTPAAFEPTVPASDQ